MCERGWVGGQERLYVRSGGIDGATVAKGLRNRDAKWYRDGVFSATVGRLANVVRRLGSAAVIVVAHGTPHAQCIFSVPIGANSSIATGSARQVTVLAVAALIDRVKQGYHEAKNGHGHDGLEGASDEEQHTGL